jgi:hypothetical protein
MYAGCAPSPRTCEETDMRRGLYRILGTAGRPNDVRVDDGGISVPVEEGIYRARGYQPPADELPWEEDYLRRHPPAKH